MQNSRKLRLALIAAIGGGFFIILLFLSIFRANVASPNLESLIQLLNSQPLLSVLIIGLFLIILLAIRLNRRLDTISQSGQYFEALFHASPVAVVTLDNDHNVIAANPSFEKLFGYKEKNIIGHEFDSLITSDQTRAMAHQLTAEALAGQNVSATAQRKRKDGRMVDVEIVGVPVNVEGKKLGVLGLYHDVTEQTRTRRALRKSEEKYRDIFENVTDYLYTHDLEANITDANQAFAHFSGYEIDELLQMNIRDLMPDDQKRFFPYYLPKVIKKGHSEGIFQVESKSGEIFVIEYKNSLILDEQEPVGIRGSARNITDRIELEKKLKQSMQELEDIARTDPLTGLYNRRGIYEHLASEHKRAQRGNMPLSIALVDLDKLKDINDNFGHIIGDEALNAIASAISKEVRAYDYVGRHGGDEFLIVLPGASTRQAKNICSRISELINATPSSQDDLAFSASIGIAAFFESNEESENLDDVIGRADDALYLAKEMGGGQVVCVENEKRKAKN